VNARIRKEVHEGDVNFRKNSGRRRGIWCAAPSCDSLAKSGQKLRDQPASRFNANPRDKPARFTSV
jgi:hypothetical protein